MQPGGLAASTSPPLSPLLFFFTSFLRPLPLGLLQLSRSRLSSCLGSIVFTGVANKQAADRCWIFSPLMLLTSAPHLHPSSPPPPPPPPGYLLICSSHEGRSAPGMKDKRRADAASAAMQHQVWDVSMDVSMDVSDSRRLTEQPSVSRTQSCPRCFGRVEFRAQTAPDLEAWTPPGACTWCVSPGVVSNRFHTLYF